MTRGGQRTESEARPVREDRRRGAVEDAGRFDVAPPERHLKKVPGPHAGLEVDSAINANGFDRISKASTWMIMRQIFIKVIKTKALKEGRKSNKNMLERNVRQSGPNSCFKNVGKRKENRGFNGMCGNVIKIHDF